MTRPAEHPRSLTRRQWAFDALITVFSMSTVVLRADAPPISGRAAAVEMLVCLPLVLRRRYPGPVFLVLVLLFGSLPVWSEVNNPNIALLIALYTVAAQESRVRAAFAAVALDAVYILALTAGAAAPVAGSLVFSTAATAGALGLGLWTGTRRSYLAELRDRAARAERERDQQHELAVATERARMTRELHDIVAHHLTVVVTLSDAAARTAVRSPEQAAEVMRQVSATGRQALAETRRVLNGTAPTGEPAGGSGGGGGVGAGRPDDADREPMPDLHGLDTLVERVRAAGLPVTFQVTGSSAGPGQDVDEYGALGPGLQLTVYRLVQEALTNTMKHAGPGATASVRMALAPEGITVTIEDDGGGRRATPAPERGGGRGLTGMRERVLSYHGEVESGPRSPAGWRVSAFIGLGTARGEP
ncbi:hypothetical protein KIH74_23125 [Kineosporia sp. J2-2]|uniref:histidine kinase n=1 Tax=Kineosporia corallincola TaxID=2835133 RepID=A0ABS5TP74_9ACTN|nr:histidine kinase [Kineosporia corallincola]MBT0771853.1 hypothetical protein [Kineosporia corallincola]